MANKPEDPTKKKPILPTEMVKTDRKKLEEMYKDIPQCIDGHDENKLDDSLFEMFEDIVSAENVDDPEHNYLIGLAYFEGISVEKNTERGIRLIENAAEMGILRRGRNSIIYTWVEGNILKHLCGLKNYTIIV